MRVLYYITERPHTIMTFIANKCNALCDARNKKLYVTSVYIHNSYIKEYVVPLKYVHKYVNKYDGIGHIIQLYQVNKYTVIEKNAISAYNAP